MCESIINHLSAFAKKEGGKEGSKEGRQEGKKEGQISMLEVKYFQ